MRATPAMILSLCFLLVSPIARAGQAPSGGESIENILQRAEQAADPCRSPRVHHLRRPYFPGNAGAGNSTFDYSYELYRPAQPGFPTILELTGGPGQALIGAGDRVGRRFPAGVGIVLLDPRGVGCNKPPTGQTFPLDFYDTRSVALDTLAVARDLGLSHYILFGSSYGSMVATEAAALAESRGETKPDSVVIEGVLGRAFRPMEAFSGFVRQWDQIYPTLPAATRAALKSSSPLGLTHDQLGNFIADNLLFRYRPSEPGVPDPNFGWLSALTANEHDPNGARLANAVRADWRSANSPEPEVATMYRAIACRELASELWGPNMDVAFRLNDQGGLAPVVKDLCRGLSIDRPYDVKDWKITAPIYYFVGGKDPSTPPNQGAYHFRSEPGADRTFVRIPEGGHSALSSSLADCEPAIFASIAQGGHDLEATLAGCRFTTELEHTGPVTNSLYAAHRVIAPATTH